MPVASVFAAIGDTFPVLQWPALLWLENYLHSLEDVVLLIVSHDRAFLDKVATDIVRFSSKTFTYYHGNYSYFEDALEKEKIDRANYAAQMKSKVDAQWEKVRRLEAEGRKRNDAKMLNQVRVQLCRSNAVFARPSLLHARIGCEHEEKTGSGHFTRRFAGRHDSRH